MGIKELNRSPFADQHQQWNYAQVQFEKLLSELRKKDISEEYVKTINDGIDQVNAATASGKAWRKQLRRTQETVLKLVEKELKFVPKNHFRNSWLVIGMSVFGIPLGVVLGLSLGNMGFVGVGLPLGMVIGMAVGSRMDKKASLEGRQLDLEIKY